MTEEQAKTATLDELRDWLAGDDGWEKFTDHDYHGGNKVDIAAWRKHQPQLAIINFGSPWRVLWVHPHPPTLDGAAAALPEGWDWSRANGVWHGWHEACTKACGCVEPSTEDTGDEIADRYRLAVLCRLAEKAVSK